MIFIILAQMLLRMQAIKSYFIFPPHLTSASALPGETRNPEIASFRLNAVLLHWRASTSRWNNVLDVVSRSPMTMDFF